MVGMKVYMTKYSSMKRFQYIYFFAIVILVPLAIYFIVDPALDKVVHIESIESGDIYKAELLDSISSLRIELGRYQVALDNLKHEDSVAASKFEDILYTIE